jgi:TAG lipase/steryl ester hydrolase/phospholipase A2/LPA acyltransferase
MIKEGDVFRLMFRLRGGLARDQYGMQHEGLFSRAKSGTKLIIEKYIASITYALDFICDSQVRVRVS